MSQPNQVNSRWIVIPLVEGDPRQPSEQSFYRNAIRTKDIRRMRDDIVDGAVIGTLVIFYDGSGVTTSLSLETMLALVTGDQNEPPLSTST